MTSWKRLSPTFSLGSEGFLTPLQQKDNKHLLDLEYVQLNVPKVLGLLKKVFVKR